MNPQTPPAESPKPVAETPQPTEPVLAEPPKGVEFTEVTGEAATPTTAGTVIQPVVVAASKKSTQKQPKIAGPKGPAKAITLAVVVFAILVGLAYYAYTQSN
jgi:hypothetical protein